MENIPNLVMMQVVDELSNSKPPLPRSQIPCDAFRIDGALNWLAQSRFKLRLPWNKRELMRSLHDSELAAGEGYRPQVGA